jgi:hypothetical protein
MITALAWENAIQFSRYLERMKTTGQSPVPELLKSMPSLLFSCGQSDAERLGDGRDAVDWLELNSMGRLTSISYSRN